MCGDKPVCDGAQHRISFASGGKLVAECLPLLRLADAGLVYIYHGAVIEACDLVFGRARYHKEFSSQSIHHNLTAIEKYIG